MNYQIKKKDRIIECIIPFVYSTFILFANRINSLLIFTLGISFIAYFFIKLTKSYSIKETLLLIMCLLMPTSFVSILGTGYGQLPITWFHVITFILLILLVKNKFRLNESLIIPILFLIFCLISLFKTYNVSDSLKQIITITFFMISFFIGEQFEYKNNIKLEKKIKYYYYLNIYIFVMMIFIQKIYYENFFIKVGYVNQYISRKVYGAYMADFSFANLYVATGALLLLIDYIQNKNIALLKFIIGEGILLFGLLIINSRTGLFAFIISTALYLLIKLFKGNYRSLIIIILALSIIPFILEKTLLLRGGQSLLDGSGRIEVYGEALTIFFEHPLIGVGFGLNNLQNIYNIGAPHNLLIQYLVQMGLVGSVVFYSIFFKFYKKKYRYNNEYAWILLMIIIGAMAIPDIPSSRFLSIIIILMSIKSSQNILKEVKR